MIDISEEAFDRTVEVNLKGPWLMMKYVVPHMIEAGGGSIINTASIGAFIAVSTAGYCAAKAGVVAMTRVAAVELGRYKIRVNALCPGATHTPMAAHQRAELAARGIETPARGLDRVIPLGHMAEPEDMARMALFLASDDSSLCHGRAVHRRRRLDVVRRRADEVLVTREPRRSAQFRDHRRESALGRAPSMRTLRCAISHRSPTLRKASR